MQITEDALKPEYYLISTKTNTLNSTETESRNRVSKPAVKNYSREYLLKRLKQTTERMKNAFGELGFSEYEINTSSNNKKVSDSVLKLLPKSIQDYSNINLLQNSRPQEYSTSASNNPKVNGILDEDIIQGETGDCWLISGLYSLNATEKGKQIIKNSIKANDDGSVTVDFKGVGQSYTIPYSDIKKYDTDNNTTDAYSNGDNDVLVLELAAEQLWKDVNSGKVNLDCKSDNIGYTGQGNGIRDGGFANQITYYLTGVEADEYYNYNVSNLSEKTISNVLQNAFDKGNTVIDVSIYRNVHSANLINGSKFSIDVGNQGHSLGITNITKDTVTIVNPWDTRTSYTMSWSQFANLGIGYLSSADLNGVEVEQTQNVNNEPQNVIEEENIEKNDITNIEDNNTTQNDVNNEENTNTEEKIKDLFYYNTQVYNQPGFGEDGSFKIFKGLL